MQRNKPIGHAPGVLCLIIGSATPHGQKFVGRTVELVKFVQPGETYMVNDLQGFKPKRVPLWLVKGDVVSNMGIKGFTMYQQKYLMPLQDPDNPFKEDMFNVDLHVAGHKVAGYAPDTVVKV